MKHPLSIAVTSVGSGIGQSIVQSCRLSRLPLKLIGLDMNATAYGAFECDRQRRIPPIADPGYVPDLVGICREERVDLLIPGLDSELPLLAESRGLFEEIGTRVLVADSAFIGLCRDKVRWSRELGPLSAAVLPCFEYGEIVPLLDSGIVDFPLIAKPRDGSASAGVVILNDRRQLAGLDPELLLQPFVFPEETDPHFPDLRTAVAGNRLRQEAEISVQWIVSKDQRLLGRMASYNRLKNGVPVEIVPIEDDRVWAALDEIFPYLCGKGMRGPVNFQGRMTEDGPRFFEMNARFTGITGLRAMLGFNEVDSLVRDFLDLAPSIAPVTHNRGRVGMRQVADRIVSPRHFPTLAKRAGDIPGYAGRGNREAVLVTGATGWLGRHLARRLALDGGYDVFALYATGPGRLRSWETRKQPGSPSSRRKSTCAAPGAWAGSIPSSIAPRGAPRTAPRRSRPVSPSPSGWSPMRSCSRSRNSFMFRARRCTGSPVPHCGTNPWSPRPKPPTRRPRRRRSR